MTTPLEKQATVLPSDGSALPAWVATGVALLVSSTYLFGAGLAAVAERWREPEYSHGYLIPLISLFLIWARRDHVARLRTLGSWVGVALVAAGLVLLVAGRLAISDIPQALAFLLVLGGLGLATLGAGAMSYLWAPLGFLLFAIPLPAPLQVALSTELQLLSSRLGAALLSALGVSVFLEGNIIDLGVYQLQVAEACSGLRYLFPLASFGCLCAWLYRAPWWARVAVLLATLPITVAINSGRIALTGLLVEYGSVRLAEGFLHLFEGWVIFFTGLALLYGVMWTLARTSGARAGLVGLLDFERAAGGPSARLATPAARRPALAPVLACLALMVAAIPLEAALAGRGEVTPARPGLVTFPLRLGDWQGSPVRIEPEILAELRADDYFLADYASPAAAAPVNLWIAYYKSQLHGHWIHSPKECLPGGGWEFVRIDQIAAPLAADQPAFALNRALIADGAQQMLMYYWYDQRGRQFTDEIWTRIYLLFDGFRIGRSDGALVRLLTPVLPGERLEAAEARLAALLRLAYPQLRPHIGL